MVEVCAHKKHPVYVLVVRRIISPIEYLNVVSPGQLITLMLYKQTNCETCIDVTGISGIWALIKYTIDSID